MSKYHSVARWKIYTLLAFAGVLCVPWWVTDANNSTLFGYPVWAVYALAMSLLFAVVIIVVIGRYWERLAEDIEDSNRSDSSGGTEDAT